MNELIFLTHTFVVLIFVLIALKFGKETLIALFCLFAVIGNLFVLKQIDLFGFHVTCSDAYTIGAILCLNFLQEYYSKKMARKASFLFFLFLIFFAILSKIHLLYLPNHFDTMHHAFAQILDFTPRIVLSSLICAYISQRIDIFCFGFFTKKLGRRFFMLRFGASAAISQLIDTVFFTFLAFYNHMDALFDVIFISYLIKMFVIVFAAPFIKFSKKIAKPYVSV